MTETQGGDRPIWSTSSYSNGAGGECVECAATVEGALVRDSKHRDGPVVTVGAQAWRHFVGSMAAGEAGRRGESPSRLIGG
ncbi:DUF397 domain-containing protein [Streptomyces sp. NPDC007264]|uniref:DUF397 domain-containing protein n=1 Tax=Streptomyces sp. NPDC007264 TaxID=3364777 RepID=UPI0036DD05A1